MMILMLLFFALLVFVFYDLMHLGHLTSRLKIWPSVDDFKNEVIILEDCNAHAFTEIEYEHRDWFINKKRGFISIVVTNKSIFFKNTKRTYFLTIQLTSIKSYMVVKALIKSRIIVKDNNNKCTTFYTEKIDKWANALDTVRIKRVETL